MSKKVAKKVAKKTAAAKLRARRKAERLQEAQEIQEAAFDLSARVKTLLAHVPKTGGETDALFGPDSTRRHLENAVFQPLARAAVACDDLIRALA